MKKILLLSAILLGLPLIAMAGGVLRPIGFGPEALARGGVGNAFGGQPQEVSGEAIFHNVALFAPLTANLIQTGFDLIIPISSYQRGIQTQDSENQAFGLPLFVYASKNEKTGCVFFSGLYSPYGMGATFEKNWRPGLNYRKSKLGLINLTHGLAFPLNEKLFAGLGIDFGYSQLAYQSPLHQLGKIRVDSIFQKTAGDGFGLGWRLGLFYQPTEWLDLGLSFSSPLRANLTGNTELYLAGIYLGNNRVNTDVTFPGRLGFGLKLKLGPKLSLGADWNHYLNRLETMKLNFNGWPTLHQQMDWHNNFTAHAGLEYQASERLKLRTGFGHMTDAIPAETINPVIPDYQPGQGIGVGGKWLITKPEPGGKTGKAVWELDMAYGYFWGKSQISPKPGNLAPGDYRIKGSIVSVAVTCRF
jgi:long-subunit fatty acid transport protein